MSESTDDLRSRLKTMMANLFRCEPSELTDSTGPGDVAGWDSLGHVSLMSEIENEFKLHVPVEDALEVASIDDLVAILQRLSTEAGA